MIARQTDRPTIERERPEGRAHPRLALFETDRASRLLRLQVVWPPTRPDACCHLSARIPPIRACREGLVDDWQAVWRELREHGGLLDEAPWSAHLARALANHDLPGNHRDLQRLAALVMAWWSGDADESIGTALAEWDLRSKDAGWESDVFGSRSRRELIWRFRRQLALRAKERYGTWRDAAVALRCDEKTLRQDAALAGET